MTETIENCQLEIDDRGVIYVHAPAGNTIVRISGVPLAVIVMNRTGQSSLIDVVDYRSELLKMREKCLA